MLYARFANSGREYLISQFFEENGKNQPSEFQLAPSLFVKFEQAAPNFHHGSTMKGFDTSKATDMQLLTRFEEGRDQLAFAEVIRRHGAMVMATAWRVLQSQEDAEDAFQATVFALAKAAGTLRKKAAVAGWLHKTAYRSAVEIQRENIRWQQKAEHMKQRISNSYKQGHTLERDPAVSVANEELARILDEELAQLPERFQVALVLCDIEGITQKKAAEQLGVAAGTMAERVTKGRRLLRDRMVRRGAAFSVAGMASCVVSSNEMASAMSEAVIADVTAKATLYAAGKSAAEVGVPATVTKTANTVISAMVKAKIIAVSMTGLAVVALVGALSGIMGMLWDTGRGTIFADNFADRNHSDGSPVTWYSSSSHPGDLDSSSGNLVLRNAGTAGFWVVAEAKDVVRRDMSVRVVAKPAETNGLAGIVVRTQRSDDNLGYFAGVGHDGLIGSYITAGIGRTGDARSFFNSSSGERYTTLPYDARDEFTAVQIDVFGDEIKVWAWRAGDNMPDKPQYIATDSTYTKGYVRLVAPQANPRLDTGGVAVFRSIHVADMPIHTLTKDQSRAPNDGSK